MLLLPPLLYAVAMLRFRQAWQQLPMLPALPHLTNPNPSAFSVLDIDLPKLSVLIAARNEAENLPGLLQDLEAQTLPAAQFEVIVVDDHSSDATASLVRQSAEQVPFKLRLLPLADDPKQGTGKKAALEAALTVAQAPWIVCTDADCRVPADWLWLHALAAADPATQFVSGPVRLMGSGWLAQLQALEMAGLVGVGAACIGQKAPTMCNGANLGYRRSTFAAVGGFTGNTHLASGDDEFLLHKMQQRYPSGIQFLKEAKATVSTAAQGTISSLLRQRVRWASKWPHYQTAAPKRLAVLVLLANMALFLGLFSLLLWSAIWPWVAGGWLLKLGADILFLRPVLQLLGRGELLWWLLPLQLLYAPYALAVALAARRGQYQWKGRQVQ
ncbi:glycosyltransferase [Hymenobacter sp. BT730]|uniref:glycosyltransferase n=1 Tax=Hymenobacter sp. BT730 TaxID=3063332 RepID=UPI0026DFDA8A|nr:glycosyltransferase [Hymenobacter sp. BT730]